MLFDLNGKGEPWLFRVTKKSFSLNFFIFRVGNIEDLGAGISVLRYRFSGTRNSVVREAKWRRRARAGSLSEMGLNVNPIVKVNSVTYGLQNPT